MALVVHLAVTELGCERKRLKTDATLHSINPLAWHPVR